MRETGRTGRGRRALAVAAALLVALAVPALWLAWPSSHERNRGEAAGEELQRWPPAWRIGRLRTAAASATPSWQSLGPTAVPDLLVSFLPGNAIARDPATMGELAAGEVTTVAIDFADRNVIYVGAGGGMWWGGGYSEGGIFGTRDGGATWPPLDAGLATTSVTSLWLDQSSPSVLVAATPAGLYRTTSSGSAWSLVESGTYRLIVQRGSLLYAGGFSGLVVSRDEGATWTPLLAAGAQVTALAGSGDTLYAGMFDGSVRVASAPGSAPQTVFPAPGGEAPGWGSLAVDPSDPSIVFGADTPGSRLFRSTDGGRSWSDLHIPSNPIIAHFAVRTVAVDSVAPNVVYVGGDEVFYRSTDGGATFSALPVGVDIWELDPLPGAAGTFLAVTDQGLYLVTNEGDTWRSLNGNLATGLTYGVAVHGSTILARSQDFSVIASFDGAGSWQMLTAAGGENGDLTFNPANPQDVYGMGTADGLTVSQDGGHDWTAVTNVPAENFATGNQVIAVDASNPSTVYAGTAEGVYVSRDWGSTWAATGWPLTQAQLVAVDPKDGRHIFVGTHDAAGSSGTVTTGELSVTSDGGATWHRVTATGVLGFPTSLDFDPTGRIVLGTSSGLAVSGDGGATFTVDMGGLPALPTVLGSASWPAVEALADVSSGSTHVVVAATTAGVFAQPAGAARWTDVSGNLISRFMHDVTQDGDSVYVATYGEGVLRAPAAAIVQETSAVPATRRLVVAVSGKGTVVSAPAGVRCPGACSSSFPAGSRVALVAQAQRRYRFAGWQGACTGTASRCRLTLATDARARAIFRRR